MQEGHTLSNIKKPTCTASVETTKVVTLSMTEDMARWLMTLIQNPVVIIESAESKLNREDIFNTIKDQGVLPY